MTKDEQINALILDTVNDEDNGFDKHQAEMLAITALLAIKIERGVIRWDPERNGLFRSVTSEPVTRH